MQPQQRGKILVVQSSDEDKDYDKGGNDRAFSKSLDAMLSIQMKHYHQ
jgi:hypothetical protein